jgi:hypothetical protein
MDNAFLSLTGHYQFVKAFNLDKERNNPSQPPLKARGGEWLSLKVRGGEGLPLKIREGNGCHLK